MKDEKTQKIIGRTEEVSLIKACIAAKQNLLIEGSVGTGKTFLANTIARQISRELIRIDGDASYTENKLVGWFNPPEVIKSGYKVENFTKGPLVQAMENGSILFINELNRMPEGIQNTLLPVLDERFIEIPRFGKIKAHPHFQVMATSNPKDFVATSQLSEALLDRFELLRIDYQSFDEEMQIVKSHCLSTSPKEGHLHQEIINKAVQLVHTTRKNGFIKRGASVRAAISMSKMVLYLLKETSKEADLYHSLKKAAHLCLPTRIELEPDAPQMDEVITSLLQSIPQKKK